MYDQRQSAPSISIDVSLSDEELSAVDGWCRANDLDSRQEGLRELVRLGLLSEIGRIFRSVQGSGEEA